MNLELERIWSQSIPCIKEKKPWRKESLAINQIAACIGRSHVSPSLLYPSHACTWHCGGHFIRQLLLPLTRLYFPLCNFICTHWNSIFPSRCRTNTTLPWLALDGSEVFLLQSQPEVESCLFSTEPFLPNTTQYWGSCLPLWTLPHVLRGYTLAWDILSD